MTQLDYFELDLVKCCLFGSFSQELTMEISFFADVKGLCFRIEAR